MFIVSTDAEVESPILWLPHAKSWVIGKDLDAGRDWGQEEKGTTEDEMAGWHHWLDGCESEWTLGVCDGQGGLACCDSWGHTELDTTEDWTLFEGILMWLNVFKIETVNFFCLFQNLIFPWSWPYGAADNIFLVGYWKVQARTITCLKFCEWQWSLPDLVIA